MNRIHRQTKWQSIAIGAALALAALAVSSSPALAEQAAARTSQCVECHQIEHLPLTLGHSMDDWRGSAHGRGGVGCEKCHGGDASATDAKAAHVGVLPSSDPKSKIGIEHVAATCGSCHQEQYDAYKSTGHAKEVSKEGDAATCVTCHGAMATSLPSRIELRARCRDCHDKPVEAESAISWLVSAKTELLRARRAIADAKAQIPEWHTGALERFHEMERSYDQVALEWHKFNMESSIKQSRILLDLAKLLEEEARLKMKMAEKKKP